MSIPLQSEINQVGDGFKFLNFYTPPTIKPSVYPNFVKALRFDKTIEIIFVDDILDVSTD